MAVAERTIAIVSQKTYPAWAVEHWVLPETVCPIFCPRGTIPGWICVESDRYRQGCCVYWEVGETVVWPSAIGRAPENWDYVKMVPPSSR